MKEGKGFEHLCMGCMREKGKRPVCPHCRWEEAPSAGSPFLLPPRSILNNRYIVGKPLLHNRYSATYLAYDTIRRQKIVIKEFLPRYLLTRSAQSPKIQVKSPELQKAFAFGTRKFIDEGQALQHISPQPGFASVLNLFSAHNTAYRVMEYLEGQCLSDFLEEQGSPLSFSLVMQIFMPVISLLSEVHANGLLHFDLCPDNIVVQDQHLGAVINFSGIDYLMARHRRALEELLRPGYAPPEFYRSIETSAPPADIYSLAATIYRALTGSPPPAAPRRQKSEPLPSPRSLNGDISETGEKVLLKALALQPGSRFSTMKAFKKSLQQSWYPADRKKSEATVDPFISVKCSHCGIINDVLNTDLSAGTTTCFACESPLTEDSLPDASTTEAPFRPDTKTEAAELPEKKIAKPPRFSRRGPSQPQDAFTAVRCPVCGSVNEVLISDLGTLAHCFTCGTQLPASAKRLRMPYFTAFPADVAKAPRGDASPPSETGTVSPEPVASAPPETAPPETDISEVDELIEAELASHKAEELPEEDVLEEAFPERESPSAAAEEEPEVPEEVSPETEMGGQEPEVEAPAAEEEPLPETPPQEIAEEPLPEEAPPPTETDHPPPEDLEEPDLSEPTPKAAEPPEKTEDHPASLDQVTVDLPPDILEDQATPQREEDRPVETPEQPEKAEDGFDPPGPLSAEPPPDVLEAKTAPQREEDHPVETPEPAQPPTAPPSKPAARPGWHPLDCPECQTRNYFPVEDVLTGPRCRKCGHRFAAASPADLAKKAPAYDRRRTARVRRPAKPSRRTWPFLLLAVIILSGAVGLAWSYYQHRQSEQRYGQFLASGDSLFQRSEYSAAVRKYRSALIEKPGEIYPQRQISRAESLLAEQPSDSMLRESEAAAEARMAERLRQADSLLALGDAEAARAIYQQLLEFAPQDSLLLSKLGEAERLLAEAEAVSPPSPPPTAAAAEKPREIAINPGTSLAAIIARAGPNTTIRLAQGIYQLSEPLIIGKSLRLQGAGPNHTLLVSSVAGEAVTIRNGAAVSVTGVGFEYQSNQPGNLLVVEDGQVAFEECAFRGTRPQGAGLVFRGSSGGTVKNSRVYKNQVGILLTDRAAPRLIDNEVGENEVGIRIAQSSRPTLTANRVRGNFGNGIEVRDDAQPTLQNNKVVENRGVGIWFNTQKYGGTHTGNEFFSNKEQGVLVDASSQPILENNDIKWNEGGGIHFRQNAKGILRNNQIQSNKAGGIRVTNAARPTIKANRIKANRADGIEILDSAQPIVDGNEIVQNGGDGISLLLKKEGGLVQNNVCKGNQGYGISILKAPRPRLINNELGGNYEGSLYEEVLSN